MKNIPFGKPFINGREKDEVSKVLDSGWLTHGPKTKEFEAKFAQFCQAKYAVSANSCTAAMHLSLLCKKIGKGDEVVVPAQTHVATAHVVMYTGAKPVFADVELETYNLSIDSLKENLTGKTKAIMPVHFAGQPCKLKEIYEIAKEKGIAVIEDAAHAIGSEYNDKKIGSFDDCTTASFSFYPVKQMTTAEGGMLVTNDEKIAEKSSLLRAFGIDKSTWKRTKTERPWRYEVTDIGYNYRMTEISAAMGLTQLEKMEQINQIRTNNAKIYEENLRHVEGILLPKTIANVKQSFSFYQILIGEDAKVSRDVLIEKLKEKEIGVSVHYPLPVPLMPAYRKLFDYKESMFPNSWRIAKEAISLPVHLGLGETDVLYVCETLKELLG